MFKSVKSLLKLMPKFSVSRSFGIEKVNVAQKFTLFDDIYVPRIMAELNGQYLKVVKFLGPYVLHKHENEDEMFFVHKGEMDIFVKEDTEEKKFSLEAGEFIIIPKGVYHYPSAEKVCEVLLFEPISVLNTGDAEKNEYTIDKEDLEGI